MVESVCSKIRAIYDSNRKKMHPETLRHLLHVMMLLPDDHKARTQIVNYVAKEYEKLHGDTIIQNEYYKQERRTATYGTVLDRKYAGKESVFTTTQFLL